MFLSLSLSNHKLIEEELELLSRGMWMGLEHCGKERDLVGGLA